MYFLPQPPYFLMFAGLFISITCGLAFEASLKQKAQQWQKQLPKANEDLLEGSGLQLPFLGICIGICLFLASGLEIFLMDRWLSYAIALPTTIFVCGLVWTQLGKVLKQLQEGGSKALDLDIF